MLSQAVTYSQLVNAAQHLSDLFRCMPFSVEPNCFFWIEVFSGPLDGDIYPDLLQSCADGATVTVEGRGESISSDTFQVQPLYLLDLIF